MYALFRLFINMRQLDWLLMILVGSGADINVLAWIVTVHQHFLIRRHRYSLRSYKVIWKLNFIKFIVLLNYLLIEIHGLLRRVLARLRLWLSQATQTNVLSLALEHWVLLVEILVLFPVIMIHTQWLIKSLNLGRLNMVFELEWLNSLSFVGSWSRRRFVTLCLLLL